MRSLALFDFDGTITTKDSFIEFIKFTHGVKKLAMGLLANIFPLIAYKAGFLANWRAKEIILEHFYKGESRESLHERGISFAKTVIPQIIRNEAKARLQWHKVKGDRIIIVSASPNIWLRQWAKDEELELISTGLEFRDDRFTGRLQTKNCYGPEKVRRVKEILDLADFEEVFAYGDSAGDTEMLALADQAFFKPFRQT